MCPLPSSEFQVHDAFFGSLPSLESCQMTAAEFAESVCRLTLRTARLATHAKERAKEKKAAKQKAKASQPKQSKQMKQPKGGNKNARGGKRL